MKLYLVFEGADYEGQFRPRWVVASCEEEAETLCAGVAKYEPDYWDVYEVPDIDPTFMRNAHIVKEL